MRSNWDNVPALDKETNFEILWKRNAAPSEKMGEKVRSWYIPHVILKQNQKIHLFAFFINIKIAFWFNFWIIFKEGSQYIFVIFAYCVVAYRISTLKNIQGS